MNDDFNIAIQAAIEAGKAILSIYDTATDFEITSKDDNSPLTIADRASNQVIINYLDKTQHPIISEENKLLAYETRKNWNTCWIVDPLDGTKEFIKKNGEFTVNIALCLKGEPIFGVIYVPVSRELYYGHTGHNKAFKTLLDQEHEIRGGLFEEIDQIFPQSEDATKIRVVGSRSHMNDDTKRFIEEISTSYEEVEIVSKGSSLKFCLVAEGKADVYPRFAPTMEWDTAAGHAICKAVGLEVIDQDTQQPMVYNREDLLNSYFLVRK